MTTMGRDSDQRKGFRTILQLACILALVAFASPSAMASTAYGDLNNFDVVNDTGQECHGFEIELDDVHSTDITYTYDWNHYGAPTITEDNSVPNHPKVFVRYAAKYNGAFSAYTAIPTSPPAPTDGHMCTNPGVNFGCEHFGVGYYGAPTLVRYNWLIEDQILTGTLIHGPAVNVATPSWNYFPPAPAQPVAQVQAVILAPPPPPEPPPFEFGDAVWVKAIVTTSHKAAVVELHDLVSDDPDDPNDANWTNGEPDEVEVEWQILQTEFNNPGGANNDLAGGNEDLPNGDEFVTRRYEFFKYTGPRDPETNEAQCDNYPQISNPADPKYKAECDPASVTVVGDYIGAQMAGFNVDAVLGLIDHILDGDINEPYTTRTVVIGGNTPYATAVTAGVLPPGLSLDSETGVLSGAPLLAGQYVFTITATDADSVQASKPYTVTIAGFGGPCDGVICDASDACHEAGSCDPATGVCSNPEKPDGIGCDDGNACTTADACIAGACSGTDTSAVDCNDGEVCTTDTCDPAIGCVNTGNNNPCSDGDACTQSDACAAGACVGTNPVICAAADPCHTIGLCDPANGVCSNPPLDGTACDDANECTVRDTCSAGTCVGDPNHCGDSVVQTACAEQCDGGAAPAGSGCTVSCQLEAAGHACMNAISVQSRKLAAKDLNLLQSCFDHIAGQKLACVAGQCVLNPTAKAPTAVPGSSCNDASDCCPDFDNVSADKTTDTKISNAADKVAKAIRSECSTGVGADQVKGTDDDTYVDPQTLGFATTCLDVLGECGGMPITALSTPGSDNDLVGCVKCAASALAAETLRFAYPLAATAPSAVTCQDAIGSNARKAGVKDLTLWQQCEDHVAEGTLACESGQCVLNPGSSKAVTVSGSACTAASDCCPDFDNVDPTKTTQAKLSAYEEKTAKATKKACSIAVGPDMIKATDDDTYVAPASVGFDVSCLDTFGRCGAMPTTAMVASGADDDLVECIACTMDSAAEHFADFFTSPQP